MVHPGVKSHHTARVNIQQHMDFMFLKGQLKLSNEGKCKSKKIKISIFNKITYTKLIPCYTKNVI